MKKRTVLKITAAMLVLVILIAGIPFTALAEDDTIHLGVFSDVHIYGDSLKGDNCDAYKEFTYMSSKEYAENYSLVNNALDGILRNAENDGADYVLIPGDLTKDGEYESHLALAGILEEWQERTGIPVFVTNGNHDINNSDACTFVNGKKEPARKTTPEEFREIYKNLGFDKADATFTPTGYSEDYDGIKGGMLSYAANLGDAFRLIVVDTSIYSVDNGAKETEHLTDGQVGDELLAWVVDQAKAAKDSGRIPLVMQHHNLVPHMEIEEATFWAFVVYDWERIADVYADAGIHYVFTGHLHASDTSSYINDNGEEITDVLSPTLTGFPNYFRTIDVSTDGTDITLDMTNYDIDEYAPVINENGKEHAAPYKYTSSFDQTFGNHIEDFLERILGKVIYNYFGQIEEAGGLIKFLAFKGIDVQQLLTDLIGTDGIALGGLNVLTVSKNAMSLIADIDRQILENYISKPAETLDKVMALIDKLLAFEVSPYPCTYNHEVLGTELTGKGCTLGEYATTALLLYYEGNEHLYGREGYEYVKDALDRFDSGENTEGFFTLLIDVLLHDLIEDEILSNINFNINELFPEGTAFYLTGRLADSIISALLGGDKSLFNLVESVLGLSVVPDGYGSIDEILDTLLLDKYLTPSQYEAWGATISWMISTLVSDFNPDECKDNTVTLTYSGKKDVEATVDNYRLPANLVMNLGEDETDGVTITWLTKYSITDTDIEITEYSENPRFTGIPTVGDGITASYEETERSYPGADLGVIDILPLNKDYIKHVVRLTGLEPGAKYSYRVGSAGYGWWSEPGTITVSSGSDEPFTFVNITDPQAQRRSHFETYKNVMDAALELYPDARFTVSNGDQVDLGTHSKQWRYFFSSSDTFRSLPFMPTAGNHEKKAFAIKDNFTLPGVPGQDEETGVYYSYDYNGVHFTVLNTNDMPDKKLGEEQLAWMKKDISGSDAQWKILVLHKALYANGIYYKDKETENLRNQLSALLPYLGVDLVLEGHNHVYTRTGAMNANAVVPCNTVETEYNGRTFNMKVDPRGTIYSIIGSAGVKEYQEVDTSKTNKEFPTAESIVSNDYPMFSAITVDGDSLYYSAYQVKDGKAELADSFGIKKSEGAKAPADSMPGALDSLFRSILSKLNVKLLWKPLNALYKLLAPVIRFLDRIFAK